MPPTNVGPDIAICGAARAGTSFLASLLGQHPAVDAGAVKESNYYSRELARGAEWYDGLYEPRRPGLLRLDASMSYTYSHFPDALENLAKSAPEALVVYSVREPVRRLLSHYQLHRDYFQNEPARTLGEALSEPEVYSGASDYARWLERIYELWPDDRVLVVPFDVVTGRTREVVDLICDKAGLDPAAIEVGDPSSRQHRNEVVEFRSTWFRTARRLMRRSGAYPWVRRTLGTDRLRRLRTRVTRQVEVEGLEEALATCDTDQLLRLKALAESSQAAVARALAAQDERLGVTWAQDWEAGCGPDASPALLDTLRART